MPRLIAVTPAAPLWTSLEAALRQTLRSLTSTAAEASAVAALEGEQARIRQSSRMWLLG